ncbi:MAG: DUF1772 domain-containing protein [Chromatiales bacterium]
MAILQTVAQFVAMVACGLFAGAAVYINLVEHPARMECGTELAATVFAPSYRRASVMQASLAALGFLSAVVAWFAGGTLWWLVGGLLLGLVIPFTLVVIMPTNRQLLEPTLDRTSSNARELLVHWGRLHAVRSVLSIFALVILIASA